MENKKTVQKDLENKRMYFLSMGFLVPLSLTMAAFNYQDGITRDREEKKVQRVPISMELMTVQHDRPKLVETQNNASSASTVSATQPVGSEIKVVASTGRDPNPAVNPELGDLLAGFNTQVGGGLVGISLDDPIHEFPNVEPTFPGGYEAMQAFITKNVRYPGNCLQEGISGMVYIEFVVEKDGSVSNVVGLRAPHPDLEKEAKRLVRSFPKWIPGESKYEKVRSRMRLPINFGVAP